MQSWDPLLGGTSGVHTDPKEQIDHKNFMLALNSTIFGVYQDNYIGNNYPKFQTKQEFHDLTPPPVRVWEMTGAITILLQEGRP